MAINFPNSPAINQTFSVGSITWKYDGQKWVSATVAPAIDYNTGEVLGNPDPSPTPPVAIDLATMLRASLGDGVAGQVVTSQGAAGDPYWAVVSGGGGGSGLTPIANNTLLSNVSGGSAVPVGNSLTGTLDSMVGSARGTLMFRGATAWSALGPGTTGQVLQTGGSSGDPAWATAATGGLSPISNNQLLANTSGASAAPIGTTMSAALDAMLGNTRGAVLVRGAGGWTVLSPGTVGQYLRTGGSGADPAWAAVVSALSGLSDVVLTGVTDHDQLVYLGGTWTNQRSKYVVGCYVPGPVTANQNLLYHRFSKAVSIPPNGGSYLGHVSEAAGSVAATASMVLTLARAASGTPTTFSNVGTITFAAGAVVGTFGTTGTVAFAQGDILRLRGPGTADVSFADLHMTLVGYET